MTNTSEDIKSYYKIETLPEFPANLFHFKKYDGLKTISVIILLITLIFFVISFINIAQNNYVMPPSQLRSWYDPLLALFTSFIGFFDSILDLFKIILISTPLILAFLLCWVIFDPKNVANYVLGISNILFGILGILNPLDTIPDFIPVVGSLDDVFSGGLMTLGTMFFFQAQKQREKVKNIVELMNEHNEERALQLLLEDKGVKLTKQVKNTES